MDVVSVQQGLAEGGAPLSGRRVLVTGATGALGPEVVAALVAAGATLRTLQRTPTSAHGIEPRVGDLTMLDTLHPALDGIDIVIHLAGLLHITNPPPSLADAYRRVNDEGTANLVRACEAAGVGRLVYTSTIAVYGRTEPGTPARTETSPCAPDTPYAVTKLAGERHALGATVSGGSSGVVLRLAAVYGAHVKGNYRRLVQSIASGWYVPVGAGRNRRTLVHESDVARALVLAATHPAAPGNVFNVTDGQVHQVRDIVVAIARAVDRRPPRLRVPVAIATVGATAIEALAGVARRTPPVTRAMLDKLLEDIAVDGRHLCGALGFAPKYGLAQGWQQVVARMRQDGTLGRRSEAG